MDEIVGLLDDGRKVRIQAESVQDLQAKLADIQAATGSKVSLDGAVSMAESAARGGAQGATLNFSDEMAGLMGLGGGIEGYKRSRDQARLANYLAQQANSKTYGGAELAGGFLMPGGAAVAAGRNAGRLAKAGRYALAGGAGGAGAALGSSDELNKQAAIDTGVGALVGGAAGAAGGTLLDTAMDTVGGGVRWARQQMLNEPTRNAQRAVREALPEGVNSPELLRNLVADQGPDSRLINAGPEMLRLAQQARQGGPRASGALETALEGQREGAVGRLAAGVRAEFPEVNQELPEVARSLRDGTRARELYDQAYESSYEPSDRVVQQFAQSKTFREVAEKVEDTFMNSSIDRAGMPGGDGALPSQVSVEYMHRFLAMLRGEVDATFRNGNASHAHELKEIYNIVDQEVKTAVPAFREAQQYYRSKMDIGRALQLGADTFTGKKQHYDLADAMEGFSETETRAFNVGLMQGLLNKVDDITDSGNTGSKVLNTPRVRKLLKQGLGPDGEMKLQRIMKLSKDEQAKSRVHSRVVNNSATGDVMSDSTQHPDSALGVFRWLIERANRQTMSAEEWQEVAKLLVGDLDDKTAKRILKRPMSSTYQWPGALSTAGVTTAGAALGRELVPQLTGSVADQGPEPIDASQLLGR